LGRDKGEGGFGKEGAHPLIHAEKKNIPPYILRWVKREKRKIIAERGKRAT